MTGWTTSWDTFKSAVHENTDICKIDKFQYLNSSLEGTASKAIQGLGLTEGNYDSAIAMSYQNMLLGFVKSRWQSGKIKFTASNRFISNIVHYQCPLFVFCP